MSASSLKGRRTAVVLLAALPLAHAVPLSAEPRASLADAGIAAFALTFLVLRWGERSRETTALVRWVASFVVLCLFGVFWSHTPAYAGAKALGYATLGVAAVGIARTGSESVGSLVDAWLIGMALAITTLAAAPLIMTTPWGADLLGWTVFPGGGVQGLTFPRASGPYAHPNALGGVLAVSMGLLWARWPAMVGGGRRWLGRLLAAGVVVSLIATASSAWLGVGLALIGWGWLVRAHGSRLRAGVGALGLALSVVVLGAALGVLARIGPVHFNGIRPAIWSSTLDAVRAAPLLGVGATPVVAGAVDPMVPEAGVVGWDAHNALLSVTAQFGLLGATLFFGAWLQASGRLLRANEALSDGLVRIRVGLLVGALAWAGDGLLAANEDARHGWLLLGLLVAAGPTIRRPQGGDAS